MRNFLHTIGILMVFIAFTGCGDGPKINARSEKQMYRSVATTLSRMSGGHRMEFEVAFWSLHNGAKDKDKFREEVNGKTPAEVIQIARADFANKKASGEEGYSNYESWDDLLKKLQAERASFDQAHSEEAGNKKELIKRRDSANQIMGME